MPRAFALTLNSLQTSQSHQTGEGHKLSPVTPFCYPASDVTHLLLFLCAWPPAVRDLPLEQARGEIRAGRFLVRIEDTRSEFAGSGGPILRYTVGKVSFEAMTIGARVLAEHAGYPQFEIWSKTGVSNHIRTLFRYQGGRYCAVRHEDLEPAEGDRGIRMPGGAYPWRLVRTRPGDCAIANRNR